jgi:alpha-glucosidase
MHRLTVPIPHSNECENKFFKEGKIVRSREVWTNVKAAWENIVDSASEEEYNSSVNTFKERYGHWPEFIEYVESTILGLIKEKFVRVWTDRVTHLGNTTTNRAESAHARLKKFVHNSLGDMNCGPNSIYNTF